MKSEHDVLVGVSQCELKNILFTESFNFTDIHCIMLLHVGPNKDSSVYMLQSMILCSHVGYVVELGIG